MNTVIVQMLVFENNDGSMHSFIGPSGQSDATETILNYADTNGFKVFLGLYMPNWNHDMIGSNFLFETQARMAVVAQQAWDRYLSGGRLIERIDRTLRTMRSLERHQGPAESGFISSPGPTEARTVLLELLSAVSAQALTLDRNAGRTHVALPPEAVAGARDALRRAWAGLGLGTQPLEAPPSMSGRAGGGQPLERDAILTFIQRGATEETLGPLGPRARK